MNLDIRDIDSSFEEAIENIKETYDNINTNTKAIRFATINYQERIAEINNKEEEILKLKRLVKDKELENSEMRKIFELLNSLLKKYN